MLPRLILSRLVELAFVLFGVSLIVFLMIRLIPGDAVAIMLGANTEVTPDRIAELRGRLGLDLPIIEQYLRWAGAALHGDLGVSIWTGRPVITEIAAHAAPTLELSFLSLIIGAGLSIPAGVLMAKWRGRRADSILRVVTVVGLTTPSFWLGIILILLFAAIAPNLQALGYTPFFEDPLGNLGRMILPAFALGFPILAQLSRLVRSAMLDALAQDYVRTARAKGLSENVVVYRHALRNALIPFVTSLGVMAGYLLGGAIVVEQVFAIPGMGRLILGAISERNYPLVQASILVVTTVFVVVNAIIDMLYVVIDPKLRG
ncbi:ABC transporter permease [Terrarubrum flagellatum]|uniref:ABC transporter permease n=1 Tax=Terrirubrum flagellatum TaxID=2895980 RepID=UPI0031452BD1